MEIIEHMIQNLKKYSPAVSKSGNFWMTKKL